MAEGFWCLLLNAYMPKQLFDAFFKCLGTVFMKCETKT